MTFDPDMAEENVALSMTNVQTHAEHRGSMALSKQTMTLGERLTQEARAIASRHLPQFSWLGPLETVRERINSHPVPDQERFQRTETRPAALPARSLLPEQPTEQWPFSAESPVTRASQGVVSQGLDRTEIRPAALPARSLLSHQLAEQRSFSAESPVTSASQGLNRPAQAAGQPLPPAFRQQLETFMGADVRHASIHTDAMADAIARTHRADAVTVKQDIFFRQGRFQPHTNEGFALLTHEAMHVVQAMRPNATWQRATQRGVQEDEHEASTWEQRALATRRSEHPLHRPPSSQPSAPEQLRSVTLPPTHASSPTLASPSAQPVSSVPLSPTSRPMTALTDRTTWPQAMPEQEQTESDNLQYTLYRDLMRRLRTDQERGG